MERVRESAVEAGISSQHVERAVEELGLVRGGRRGVRVDAPMTPLRDRPILTPLFAAPFRLQEETEVDGRDRAGRLRAHRRDDPRVAERRRIA